MMSSATYCALIFVITLIFLLYRHIILVWWHAFGFTNGLHEIPL